jgi:hypothetical protein
VENDGDPRQIPVGGMLRDPLGRPHDDPPCHFPGPVAPALVGMLVDVTVIAGEIASAVHLEDELRDALGWAVFEPHHKRFCQA